MLQDAFDETELTDAEIEIARRLRVPAAHYLATKRTVEREREAHAAQVNAFAVTFKQRYPGINGKGKPNG